MVVQAILGGVCIGLAGGFLLLIDGRILGASGIISQFLAGVARRLARRPVPSLDFAWRALFIFGALVGGAALRFFGEAAFMPRPSPASVPTLVVAGLCVGIGTRLGLGCTSGHGVGGIGRFSVRSLVATLLFMGAGIVTVFLVRQTGSLK